MTEITRLAKLPCGLKDLADSMGVPLHRIRYAAKRAGVGPFAKAGVVGLYDRDAVAAILKQYRAVLKDPRSAAKPKRLDALERGLSASVVYYYPPRLSNVELAVIREQIQASRSEAPELAEWFDGIYWHEQLRRRHPDEGAKLPRVNLAAWSNGTLAEALKVSAAFAFSTKQKSIADFGKELHIKVVAAVANRLKQHQ